MSQQHGLSGDADDSDKSLTNSLDSPPTSTPRESFYDLAQTDVSKGCVHVPKNTKGVVVSRVAQCKRKGSKKKGKLPSGTGGRGLGFSAGEIDSLLELLDAHQPLRKDDWDIVLWKHSERHSGVERMVESLRRKFASLYRMKAPTRDQLYV